MITTLTNQFLILKEKYIEIKKELAKQHLIFIEKTSSTGSCVVCGKFIESNNINSIEERLCKFCIIKIYSKPIRMLVNFKVPDDFLDVQKFVENITKIEINFKNKIKKHISIKEIEDIYQLLRNNMYNFNITIDDSLFNNLKQRIIQDRLKRLIKNQIEFKIKVFEEQFKKINKNYEKALISGDFEDSKAFKEMLASIFETKIKLEERLDRYKA